MAPWGATAREVVVVRAVAVESAATGRAGTAAMVWATTAGGMAARVTSPPLPIELSLSIFFFLEVFFPLY